MNKFIKYFWSQEGFTYDPLAGQTFSIYHLNMLMIAAVFYLLVEIIGDKVKNKKRYLSIIAVILLVLEVIRVINWITIFNVNLIGSLSFHLCAMGIYLAIIAGIVRKAWVYELFFLHAIIGSPLALLIPVGILPWFNEYSFLPLQSFISHALLIYMFIGAYKYNIVKLNIKRYIIPVAGLFISTVIAYQMSIYNLEQANGGQTNFFWTRHKDPLLESITNISYPYLFYLLLLILISVGFIFYLILIRLKKSEQTLERP